MPFRPTSDPTTPIIRASEIGQYVFCQRAWWLGSVQGYRPVNEAVLNAGGLAHTRHGRTVATSQRWQRLAYVLLILGSLLLAMVLCSVLEGGL